MRDSELPSGQNAFILHLSALALAACFTLLSPARAAEVTEAQAREDAAQWDAAFNAGDADALANLYAEDATLVPPKRDAVTGRPAIREFWANLFKSGFKSHAIQLESVRNKGDVTIAVGKWTVEGPGDGGAMKQYNGQLVNVMEAQSDGQRRSILHTWN